MSEKIEETTPATGIAFDSSGVPAAESVKDFMASLDNVQKEDAESWSTLLKHLNNYDGKTLKDWQDELANLLTFTGLFSAVVTGFIAYALPKLEEDFAETSARLLKFVVMGSKPASDDPSLQEFKPGHKIVHVNVLWMASLNLSLMAAFFTIAVQQWLRHIPLPSQLTVREAVRLRQLRHDGLLAWNVPTIVSLLPTMVQLSVLLFLIGLLLQLNSLNKTVSAAFGGIAGTLFALYIVTVPLPLLWSHCPYKSPVVPTVWAVLQICASVVTFTCYMILVALVTVVQFVGKGLRSAIFSAMGKHNNTDLFDTRLYFYRSRVDMWIYRQLGRLEFHNFANWDLFWTERERRRTRQAKDSSLDSSAVSSVLVSLPLTDVQDILPCLKALDTHGRVTAILKWITHNLGNHFSDVTHWLPASRALPPLYSHLLKKIDATSNSLAALRETLYSYLPQDSEWKTIEWTKPENRIVMITSTLSMLCQSTLAEKSETRESQALSGLVKLLMAVRDGQWEKTHDMVTKPNQYMWLPTTLLFKTCYVGSYPFDTEETELALQWAAQVLSFPEDAARLDLRRFMHVFEGALAAFATALAAICQTIHCDAKIDTERLGTVFGNFDIFLRTATLGETIRILYLVRPTDTCSMLYVDEDAMLSISNDMLTLAEWQTRVSAMPSGTIPCLARIVDRLKSVCEERAEYRDAAKNFDTFLRGYGAKQRRGTSDSVAQSGHMQDMSLSMVETLPRTARPRQERSETVDTMEKVLDVGEQV